MSCFEILQQQHYCLNTVVGASNKGLTSPNHKCFPKIEFPFSAKVHLFLKQCLHYLQLTQFDGTSTKPFKLALAERFGEGTTKLIQLKIV